MLGADTRGERRGREGRRGRAEVRRETHEGTCMGRVVCEASIGYL